jgi:precorrin-6B methylase 2
MRFPGFSRVRSERRIGPDEGVDDEATIESYDTVNRQLPSRALRLVCLRRLKKMKPQGVMADLGCGPGFFTGEAAGAFPEVRIAALDISSGMLERATVYLDSKKAAGRIELILGTCSGCLSPTNRSIWSSAPCRSTTGLTRRRHSGRYTGY